MADDVLVERFTKCRTSDCLRAPPLRKARTCPTPSLWVRRPNHLEHLNATIDMGGFFTDKRTDTPAT